MEDRDIEQRDWDAGSEGSSAGSAGAGLLGATLDRDALARTLVDTQTANELSLIRSEVRRLRHKVRVLEGEKDDMVDNFRSTTQILLNRIKDLEAERCATGESRPQTAAVIERIEGRPKGSPPTRPPILPRSGSGGGARPAATHAPEVLRIEEEPPSPEAGSNAASASGGGTHGGGPGSGVEDEDEVCGNCGRSIPVGNMVSHSVFCYRNNYRCAACNEVISQRDKEKHIQQWRDPVRLMRAIAQVDIAELQAMEGHGMDFHTVSNPETGDSVLHAAARVGDANLISFFMGYGVEVDPTNSLGETPLHLTVEVGEVPPARLLIELGAELNVRSNRGDTPLILACRKGAAEVAKLLVEQRADAEVCTKLGDTPVQIAQRAGFHDTVQALCSAGAPLRSGTPRRARGVDRSDSPLRCPRVSPSPPAPVPQARHADAGSTASRGSSGGYPSRCSGRRRDASPVNPSLVRGSPLA